MDGERICATNPSSRRGRCFCLHYVPGLGDRYLATPPRPTSSLPRLVGRPTPAQPPSPPAISTDPRYVEQIEWFASPADICRAFAGLQLLSKTPSLSPLATVLSLQAGGIGLDPSVWPTVWYKGGSEPGVLTLGWLATNRRGQDLRRRGHGDESRRGLVCDLDHRPRGPRQPSLPADHSREDLPMNHQIELGYLVLELPEPDTITPVLADVVGLIPGEPAADALHLAGRRAGPAARGAARTGQRRGCRRLRGRRRRRVRRDRRAAPGDRGRHRRGHRR